jgi:hypothetical protein
MPPYQKKSRRRFNTARIKRDYSYKVHELARCLGTCKGTIRQWQRKGMPTIDDRRPYRFHGREVIAFIRERQAARRHPCKEGELYCFGCKHPRRVRGRQIDIRLLNPKLMNLIGVCDECGGTMHQLCGARRLPEIASSFVIQRLHNGHIAETLPPSLKCHLPMES